MKVRPAGLADLLHILPLLAALARSFGPRFPDPDMAKIERLLRDVLARGFVIVAEGQFGQLIGVLALERGELPFASEPALLDRAFYAVPGSGAGDMLRCSAKAIGAALGLPVYVTRLGRATVRL
jgi:hypothetical protein